MRKILLINLSPRKKGTSVVLLGMCEAHLKNIGAETQLLHLYALLNNFDTVLSAIRSADTVIFGGPCYINTYPADTTALLQRLSLYPDILRGKSVYGIIQGGMPYAHTHASGLSMLALFCKRYGMDYKGGFVMGMGAMLDGKPVSNLPHGKRVIRGLETFFTHIEKNEASPAEVYLNAQFKAPVFVYRLMAKFMNRIIDRDLKKHGIDVRQKSPYLAD